MANPIKISMLGVYLCQFSLESLSVYHLVGCFFFFPHGKPQRLFSLVVGITKYLT